LSSAAFLQQRHSSHAPASDVGVAAELCRHAVTASVVMAVPHGTIHRCGSIVCAASAGAIADDHSQR
jgi:hypothetical protein